MMRLKDCFGGFLQVEPGVSNRQRDTDGDGCVREIDNLLHPSSRSAADSYFVGAFLVFLSTLFLGLFLFSIIWFMLESIAKTFA